MTTPLTDLSATDAIAAMRDGNISAEAYATALLDRCEAGAHLNAFISYRALNAYSKRRERLITKSRFPSHTYRRIAWIANSRQG